MDFVLLVIIAFGGFGLFWYGFARSLHTKKEWVEGKQKETKEMIPVGLLLLIIGIVIAGFISL
jgi:succinate-acetate transporter protein